MRLRKYWYIGIVAGIVLSLTGCGEKEKAAETEKAATQEEAQEKTDNGKTQDEADTGNGDSADGELSIADVVGEKGAKLFEETSEEELLAMIPETEIPVAGYYQYYASGRTSDIEITGHMKEFELISRDNECITVKGIIENDGLKTEQPVQGIYFISINEDVTELRLISATVTDAPETVHIIPTVPFPTVEQLLDMGLAIKLQYGNNTSEPVLLKDYVTEIWYDEEDMQEDLTDWDYSGKVHYVLNGMEQRGGLWLQYPPYEDAEADAEWIFAGEHENVFDTIKLEESGIPDDELIWP